MVGIVCSSSFHWYYTNHSRNKHKTQFQNPLCISKSTEEVVKLLSLKMMKNSMQVSGNKATKNKSECAVLRVILTSFVLYTCIYIYIYLSAFGIRHSIVVTLFVIFLLLRGELWMLLE